MRFCGDLSSHQSTAPILARNLTRVHVLWCDEPQTRALLPSGPSSRSNIANGYPRRRRSLHQRRLTPLQEASNGRVALEADCDFVGVAGLVVRTCLGQQLRTCRPVGLVFGESHIGGQLTQVIESGAGAMYLR